MNSSVLDESTRFPKIQNLVTEIEEAASGRENRGLVSMNKREIKADVLRRPKGKQSPDLKAIMSTKAKKSQQFKLGKLKKLNLKKRGSKRGEPETPKFLNPASPV